MRDELESQPYLDAIQAGVAGRRRAQPRLPAPSTRCRPRRWLDYENIVARLRALPAVRGPGDRADRRAARRRAGAAGVVVDLMLDQLAAQRAVPAARVAAAGRVLSAFPTAMPGTAQRRLRGARPWPPTRSSSCRAGRGSRRTCATAIGRGRARSVGLGVAAERRTASTRGWCSYFTTTHDVAPSEIHQLGLRGGGPHRARDAGDRAASTASPARVAEFERELASRPGHAGSRARTRCWPTPRTCWPACSRAADALLARPAHEGARAADSAGSRGLDGVELHRRAPPTARVRRYFNMNTYRPREQVKYTIEALVLHEPVPGHHLQVGARARAARACPRSGRAFRAAAFGEGWGLYAEVAGRGRSAACIAMPPTRFGRLAERAVPRRAPGRRHRHPRDGLDARAGARRISRARARASRWRKWTATSPGPARRWPTRSGS